MHRLHYRDLLIERMIHVITSGANYFRKDNDGHIIFTGKYMEVYISQYYFEKKCAELIGTHFRTLGVLNFRTFADVEGKKPDRVKVFNLPVEITTFPSGGYEVQKLDLVGKGEQEYYVLKYYNGDVFCNSEVMCSTATFSLCMNVILGGKLPETIPYDAVMEIWDDSFNMNAVDFNVPDLTKELCVAQVYRDPKNIENTFGSLVGKNPKHDMYSYRTVSSRELTSANSTFNGLIFEDWDEMVRNGCVNTKTNKKENVSPMEEILKY